MNLLVVSAAWAHRPGLSYAQFDDGQVAITLARPELASLVPVDDLDAARLVARDATLGAASFTVNGAPCTLGEATIKEVEEDGVRISAPLTCPVGPIHYEASFLANLAPGHRHYVQVGDEPAAVLDASSPSVTFTPHVASTGEVAGRFVGLGLEHIWTGYDHLAFLFGLLLVARSLREMLMVVTGFTVAHSITLSAAALGLFTLSPRLVEPMIAASIVYVGVENFWRPAGWRRVGVTFFLGLVHGFGFAGLLAELGLPRHALAVALLSFNGGVEIGQATIVAVLLPILLALRRTSWWDRRAVPVLSVGVALAGLAWLVERI